MPIIIDGWNLLRSDESRISDEDDARSLEAALELLCCLEHFQRSHADPIVLVFDSKNEYLGIEHKNNAKFSVVAAKNADNYIKRYIEKIPERQRRNLRVVSSDKDVYYYAKSAYASPVTSDEFWKVLDP